VPILPSELHHPEIADDHLFIGCARAALTLEQIFGNLGGGLGPL
jgi:hypothetical protein